MMGTKNLLMLKTQFESINKHFINEFVYGNMLWLLDSIWVFVCNYVLYSFGLIIRYVSRYDHGVRLEQDDQIERHGFQDSVDGFRKEEGDNREGETAAAMASNYQFLSVKDITGCIEEPKALSFSFQEYFVAPKESSISENTIINTRKISQKEFTNFDLEDEDADQQKDEESVQSQREFTGNFISHEIGSEGKVFGAISNNTILNDGVSATKDLSLFNLEEDAADKENELEDSVQKQRIFPKNCISAEVGLESLESKVFGQYDSSYEDEFLFSDLLLASDSESESSVSSDFIWESNDKIDDSATYDFLAHSDVSEGLESESAASIEEEKDEYIEIKPSLEDSRTLEAQVLVGMDFGGDEDKGKRKSLEKSEENNWGETESSSDEDDDLDWEHEDIIEQLKQEIRNARTGGLTTILEEDEEELESPQMVQGLKPLKIEEKVEYKDIMNEIHKVYKTYVEKMRKLDVLNYQTMHAIGFLQLKDPVKLISMQNPKVPGAKPLLSQNLWPLKAQKNIDDPMLKFVGELNRDLELVYVGQVCLSWEILHWQQGKAQELKEYDLQGCHQYNQVADEFQLFQVLLQRFIENEPFQGPRVRNYVKNRCVIRNLLQVPAIRDDYTKDKNIKREYGNEISSKMLTEIINESMRVFREFVCADKDEDGLMIKVSRQRVVDCKDSGSSKLVIDVRTNLQKKEKKLKDILRTRNCLVKKFQKHRVRQLEHDQFLAQVELKLISKVLSLSKLTEDQLIWCHEKLDRITIADRKVHVEPSFLLFPC